MATLPTNVAVVLNANTLKALLADGANVGTWANNGDLSVAAALQDTSTKQPILRHTGAPDTTKPYVQFEAGDWMSIADHVNLTLRQSLFAVFLMRTGGTARRFLLSKDCGTGCRAEWNWYQDGGNQICDRPWIQGGTAQPHGQSANTWYRVAVEIDGTTVQHYRDTQTQGNSYSLKNGDDIANALIVGAESDQTDTFTADVACVVVYARALTAAEKGEVDTWIQQEFYPAGPPAPGILDPTENEVHDQVLTLTVEDVSAAEYKVEIENGDEPGWSTLVDWTATRPNGQQISLSNRKNGSDWHLRAYARDSPTFVSAAGAVRTFAIAHPLPDKPTILMWVDRYTAETELCFLGSVYSAGPAGPVAKSVWQFSATTDFSSPLDTTEIPVPDYRIGINLVDEMNIDSNYYARVKYSDGVADSPWSDPVRGKTARYDPNFGGGTNHVLARDQTAAARHAMYGAVGPGSDGSSYLLLNEMAPKARFPAYALATPPFSSDTADLAFFTKEKGGGNYGKVQWRVAKGSSSVLTKTRHDAQASCVDFAFMLRGKVHALPDATRFAGVLAFADPYDTDAPLNTRRFGHVLIDDAGILTFAWFGAANLASIEYPFGTYTVGQTFSLRVSCVLKNGARLVYLNGSTVTGTGDVAAWDALEHPCGILDVCHNFGAAPNHENAPQIFRSVISEYVVWWDEPLNHLDANDLPALESLAANPTAQQILDTSPVVYYRFRDPDEPAKPTLTQA